MAGDDVVMGENSAKNNNNNGAEETAKEKQKKPHPRAAVYASLRNSIELIERGVSQRDSKLITRALRPLLSSSSSSPPPPPQQQPKTTTTNSSSTTTTTTTPTTTTKNFSFSFSSFSQRGVVCGNGGILFDLVVQSTNDSLPPSPLLAFLPKNNDIDMTTSTTTTENDPNNTTEPPPSFPKSSANLPEVEAFLHLLVLVYLIDTRQLSQAKKCGESLVQKTQSTNRRMFDPLAAKAWFYYSLVFELSQNLLEIRDTLMGAYRTATLHHHTHTQSVLIVLLLRNYLHFNQFHLADKLIKNVTFPENASNAMHARYEYYVGRIQSVQLEYSEAFASLTNALRKSPQSSVALGFRGEVNKFLIVVQLLTGEIPSREIFNQKGLRAVLLPYLKITQAVRLGDIVQFENEMKTHQAQFQKDKTYTLITRLRRDVIKTALRNVSLAYSRISLQDICTKLQLTSTNDTEYMVAKAISDGVIDGKIERIRVGSGGGSVGRDGGEGGGEGACLVSCDVADVYASRDPQLAFNKRIDFCVKIRNDAIKAMRYPENSHKGDVETPEQRRERLAAEADLASHLAEEDDDDMADY